MHRVQLKPLLHDVNGADSKLKMSGVGDVKLIVNTEGMTREQLYSHLNGVVDFGLNDGVVEGLDLNYLVQTANELLNGHAISMPTHIEETQFEHLTGTMMIKNGVAHTDNLLLLSQAFITKGEGNINLLKQSMHFQLLVTPMKKDKIQWNVPVLVTGDLHHPSIRVDVSALQTELVKNKLEKVKSKVKEEIKKLPDDANKFLQKLIGN